MCRTPIFDKPHLASETQRVAEYGAAAEYANRVEGVFCTVTELAPEQQDTASAG